MSGNVDRMATMRADVWFGIVLVVGCATASCSHLSPPPPPPATNPAMAQPDPAPTGAPEEPTPATEPAPYVASEPTPRADPPSGGLTYTKAAPADDFLSESACYHIIDHLCSVTLRAHPDIGAQTIPQWMMKCHDTASAQYHLCRRVRCGDDFKRCMTRIEDENFDPCGRFMSSCGMRDDPGY
jgi:hypothetical protein